MRTFYVCMIGVALGLGACSGDSDDAGGSGGSGAAGMPSNTGAGTGSAGTGATAGAQDSGAAMPSAEEVSTWIDAYAAARPGADGDISAKTPAQLATDPEAQRLYDLCGEDQLPVIPALVWEYGGNDHAWMSPEGAALVYCVYTPVSPDSEHWQYDAAADHVTADVYVLYPEQNPCKDAQAADQVAMCIGDPSNFEILVDSASLDDGHAAGLELSEASTELMLILPDDTKLHLFDGA